MEINANNDVVRELYENLSFSDGTSSNSVNKNRTVHGLHQHFNQVIYYFLLEKEILH